jgi:hypothetical protein
LELMRLWQVDHLLVKIGKMNDNRPKQRYLTECYNIILQRKRDTFALATPSAHANPRDKKDNNNPEESQKMPSKSKCCQYATCTDKKSLIWYPFCLCSPFSLVTSRYCHYFATTLGATRASLPYGISCHSWIHCILVLLNQWFASIKVEYILLLIIPVVLPWSDKIPFSPTRGRDYFDMLISCQTLSLVLGRYIH